MLRSLLTADERQARLQRDGGWKGVLGRELRSVRIKMLTVTRMVFLVDELGESLPTLRAPEGIRIEPYEGDDWELFRELAGPRQRRKYAARRAAGRTLLVAWRENQPIGLTWITSEATMALDGLRLDLPKGWAYAYQLYVHPSARSGGIGSALTNARMNHARALGFTHLCRAVRVRNTAALRSAAKAKGTVEPFGKLRMYHLFGYKWVRWNSGR